MKNHFAKLALALVILALPFALQPTVPQADGEPVLQASFEECLQCYQDCQYWQEPTRSQCEAWCYNTIPACHT